VADSPHPFGGAILQFRMIVVLPSGSIAAEEREQLLFALLTMRDHISVQVITRAWADQSGDREH
jgi:hypothetical protein